MARPLHEELERLQLCLAYAATLADRMKASLYKNDRRDARLRKKAGFKSKRKAKK